MDIFSMAIDGDKIIAYMKAKGYEVESFNIVGLEGMSANGNLNADQPDYFNDTVALVNGDGRLIDVFTATTEPGIYYTRNPLNRNGCARLAIMQHKDIWAFGTHKNQSPALVQVGVANLNRDLNQDGKRTSDRLTAETGTGINCHTTGVRGSNNAPDVVGKWSAGCVVIRSSKYYFEEFIPACQASGLNRFNFTLIDGSDFAKFSV